MTSYEPEPLDDLLRPGALIRRLAEAMREVPIAWKVADKRALNWIELGMETSGFEKLARRERAVMGKVVDRFYLKMQDAMPYLSESVQRDVLKVAAIFDKCQEPRAFWEPDHDQLLNDLEWLMRAAAKEWDREEEEARRAKVPTPEGTPKLPELQRHDREAWQASLVSGMTQQKIAGMLNAKHGTTYTQGQVSRMIGRAKAHADANGLTDKLPKPAKRERAIDPARLELGPRIDKSKPRASDLKRGDS